jgi:hypothetical protein
MNGTIPPLPQYAFTALCSIKKSTGTTLLLGTPNSDGNADVSSSVKDRRSQLTNKQTNKQTSKDRESISSRHQGCDAV